MAGGGLFGGIGAGVQSGVQLYQARRRGEASAEASDALARYREGQLALSKRRLEIQERNSDLMVTQRLTDVLTKDMHPQAKSFLLDEVVRSIGGDPKSERYKDLKKVIVSMPTDQANALAEAMTTALPNTQPGQIKTIIEGLLKGGISPADIPKTLQQFNTSAGRAQAFGGPSPGQGQASAPATNLSPLGGGQDIGQTTPPNVEGMSVQELRNRARQLGAAGDLEGARTMLQMARDVEGKPSTSINFVTEKEGAKNLSKRDFGRLGELDKEADAARAANASLDAFEVALEGGRFTPGFAGTQRRGLSQIAEFIGLDPEDPTMKMLLGTGDPASAEAMQAASNRLALDMADKLSKMTNMSLAFIQDSVPNLARTPDGNKLIIEMIRAGNSRTLKAQNLAEEYLTNYGTLRPEGKRSFFQELDRLRQKPLFDDSFVEQVQKEARKGAGVDPGAALQKLKSEIPDSITVGEPGNEQQYSVVGQQDGMPIVELPRGRFPVVRSTEEYDSIKPNVPFVWGPNGDIYIKRGK